MSPFLEALRTTPLLADGATGTLLFERTGRLSEAHHVYEALSLERPDLIRQVHFDYLQAGARCLTTNTFAANRTHLSPLGEVGRVAEINHAAVRLARQAIAEFSGQSRTTGPYFVFGSLGPTLAGGESAPEVQAIYREQVEALLAEGVDALLLETFSSLPHVTALLELVRSFESPPPLVVQMTLHQPGPAGAWEQDPVAFVRTAAALGAQVVGVNCCTPGESLAFLEAVQGIEAVAQGRLLLSAMPNAGGFQRIGHRYMTSVNPEYMGRLARTLAERGARLVGGCCAVHPPHINEMHNYLQGRQAGSRTIAALSIQAREPAGPAEKQDNGPFSRKLTAGEFAVSVEILPPRGTAPGILQGKLEFAAELAESGLADALDLTDSSRGIPLMPPGDLIGVLREHLGWDERTGDRLELIPHFTTRDLNVMGLQSRLIGYWARRIHNVLFVTGDPPKMSPTYPRSSAVFDLDSVAMIHYAHTCLNAGVDFGGQPLGKHRDPRTHFTIGSGFEPEALEQEREVDKLRRKVANGADYLMTQPAFRPEPLAVLEPFRPQVAILVGVMIATGLEHVRRIGQVPGVVVPEAIYARLGKYDKPEDQAAAGKEIAVEQVRWVRQQGWAGLYLMSPATHQPVLEVLRAGLS